VTDGLPDTSFFIDIRRGGDEGADKLWDAIKNGERTEPYSAVTVYELWVGQRFSREEELLYESMFVLLEPTAIEVEDAKRAGQWLRAVSERSELIFRDALIASAAVRRQEFVVTRNVSDFCKLPSVEVESY
jgi:tRNA(fMet)-specific endonuclease VapC